MGETYGQPEVEPTVAEQAEPFLRNAIAGHPQGAVRRIVLYVAAGVLMVSPLPLLAIVPLLLLALTDQLA